MDARTLNKCLLKEHLDNKTWSKQCLLKARLKFISITLWWFDFLNGTGVVRCGLGGLGGLNEIVFLSTASNFRARSCRLVHNHTF